MKAWRDVEIVNAEVASYPRKGSKYGEFWNDVDKRLSEMRSGDAARYTFDDYATAYAHVNSLRARFKRERVPAWVSLRKSTVLVGRGDSYGKGEAAG